MLERILAPGFLYSLGMKATYAICIAIVFECLVWFFSRSCNRMLQPIFARDVDREAGQRVWRRNRLRDMSRQGVRGTLYLIALLMILEVLDVKMEPVYCGLILVALVGGWACRYALANSVAGFILLCTDQMATGDRVEVDGVVGTVEEMNLHGVRLKSEDGRVHFIANRKVATASVSLSRSISAKSALGPAQGESPKSER